MRRWLLALLLCLSPVFAQDKQIIRYGEEGQKQCLIEEPPQDRLSKRLLFVFDKSGSMRADRFLEALEFVSFMMSQAVDSYEVSLIAFDASTHRWPGAPEPDKNPPIPPNWGGLPSDDVVKSIMGFLEFLGAGGDTVVRQPLREALAEPRNDLTIILVSDGIFQREQLQDILITIDVCQKDRIKAGLQPAGIMVFGVTNTRVSTLAEIAKVGKMGYMRHYRQ